MDCCPRERATAGWLQRLPFLQCLVAEVLAEAVAEALDVFLPLLLTALCELLLAAADDDTLRVPECREVEVRACDKPTTIVSMIAAHMTLRKRLLNSKQHLSGIGYAHPNSFAIGRPPTPAGAFTKGIRAQLPPFRVMSVQLCCTFLRYKISAQSWAPEFLRCPASGFEIATSLLREGTCKEDGSTFPASPTGLDQQDDVLPRLECTLHFVEGCVVGDRLPV